MEMIVACIVLVVAVLIGIAAVWLVVQQKKETERMQQRLTTEFENIANRVLQQRQDDFTQQSSKQLGDILLPLNERIKDFREQVNTAFSQETREKASLQAELRQLIELNQTLSKDATSLTQALKGDVKKQGNWGEFILEKVLEASGLRKGIEYDREVVVHGVEGDTLRPDVIIRMPDNKHIIVDSKVSLVAYEQLQHAETDEQYKAILKAHVESLKQHVKELYDKQYQRATGLNTPDFVLMFVPIEASYSVAIQADSTLYDYALERKIVIVSPTTLLATLHTISYVWKQDNQSKNALEIARLAGAMYDKLSGALEDFQKVQKSLDAAQKSYEETYKKLSEGKGNVLTTADKIRELGAKASKSLPQNE
ncbi:MAG: DNA recombination protein RmuC [Paludibacteraceae bacterium]|nr:DNA recombination protein RmuC [Paludibacteraceae bacterium]MBO7455132.1 DNA recombination protein RmuC [Paludibacteraceae bacterium]